MNASGTDLQPFAGATLERIAPAGGTPQALAGGTLAAQLHRAERRRKLRALALTMPLLVFLLVFFLFPRGPLLGGAFKPPEVPAALPTPGRALADGARNSPPPAAA